VHRLGCLVALKKRVDRGPILAVLTLGLSEIVSQMMAELVVPQDRLPPIVDALGQAFCDASPEVGAVAERELRAMRAPVAGLALGRAARSCDGPRAVAAVGVLEERLVAFLVQQLDKEKKRDPYWSDLVALAPPLSAAAASEKAEVRERAQAALAKAGAVLDPLLLERAASSNPETITAATAEARLPLFVPALLRAAPAFRARLTDADYRIRLAAAQTVWRLEGATAASLDALAKDLWAGIHVPAPVDPAAGERLEKMLGQLDPPPDSLYVDLGNELFRLAFAGPSAAPALGAIRACLTIPEKKLRAIDAHQLAEAALAFVGRDRATLPLLRKRYDAFFADSRSMAYLGAYSELTAQAILTLEPDDPKARRALGIEPRTPLLLVVTRRALAGEPLEWWVRLLLLRVEDAPPAPAPKRGP
jgi:hypothetical protein